MKRFLKLIIILFVFIILVTGCGNKEEKKVSRNTEEIRYILNDEKDYLNTDNLYAQYFSISDYKESDFDIEWITKKETVNIKGNIINGYVAYNEANNNAIILSEDGTLYRKKGIDYSIIKSSEKITRLGLYYPHEGGHSVCSALIDFVLENESGIHLVTFEDNGIIISSNTIEKGNFELPLCYGKENSSFKKYLYITLAGEIGFSKDYIVDKITSKPLKVSHVIYTSAFDEEKYYVITDDNTLYILDDDKTNVEAIAKVNIEVKKALENEIHDVDISITYDDIVLDFKNVINDSL